MKALRLVDDVLELQTEDLRRAVALDVLLDFEGLAGKRRKLPRVGVRLREVEDREDERPLGGFFSYR